MAMLQLSKNTIPTEISESSTGKFDTEHEDSSCRFSKEIKSEPAEEDIEIFQEELSIKDENVKVERVDDGAVPDDEISNIDKFKEQIQQLIIQIQPKKRTAPDSDNLKVEQQEPEYNFHSESCETKSEFGSSGGNTVPKRNYPKKREFCMFCKSLITNICRHFQTKHKDVHEVQEFEKLRKGTVERAKLIANLRNAGNFEYNFKTEKRKSDQLILARNKRKVDSENYDGDQYIPCLNCKATYSKSCIARHYKRCNKNPITDTDGRIMKIPSFANDVLRKEVLPHMNQDTIFRILIKDKMIILFGNHLTKKGLESRSIIRKLRFLARYFQVIKNKCPNITELGQLFQDKYFDLAMDGVRDLSGRSHEMLRILKVCCGAIQLEYDKQSDFEMAMSVAKFEERLSARSGSKRKKVTKSVTVSKKTWSDLERRVAQHCFQAYIDARKIPPMHICREAMEENPVLKNRSVYKIRSWIQNQIKNSVSDQTNKQRVAWTLAEKAKVIQLFGEHILNGTYPSSKEMELATKQPELRNRSPEKIRSFLQHQMKQRRVI